MCVFNHQIQAKDCFFATLRSKWAIMQSYCISLNDTVVSLRKAENAWWNLQINNGVIACSSHAVRFTCLHGEHSIMERFTSLLFALVAVVNVAVLMGRAMVDSLRGFRGTSTEYEDQIEPRHQWGQRSSRERSPGTYTDADKMDKELTCIIKRKALYSYWCSTLDVWWGHWLTLIGVSLQQPQFISEREILI